MHPRVLIVSPSVFNQFSGGGVLLTNFFRGWPRERIAMVHGDPLPADTAVCGNFFRVGLNEISWARPFSLLQKRQTTEQAATRGGGVHLDVKESGARRVLKGILGPELPWRARVSPALADWIRRFDPEVIHVLPGGPYIRLALEIAERWPVPVVVHMMDDWPSAPRKGLLGPFIGRRLDRDLRRLFARAVRHFGITDAMAEAYKKRYGPTFLTFQNPVDYAARIPHARTSWERGRPFRLVYIGSILPQAQLQSLGEVAKAVGSLARAGHDVRLDIHSAWSDRLAEMLPSDPAVGFHPGLDDQDVFPALVNADLLALPVNFDEASLRFIRYSMPVKVPIYLASGTPILAYGPLEAVQIRYAKEAGWAEVVSQHDGSALEAAILKLAGDARRREELGKRAQEVARLHHDAAVVRASFQKNLMEAVVKP